MTLTKRQEGDKLTMALAGRLDTALRRGSRRR